MIGRLTIVGALLLTALGPARPLFAQAATATLSVLGGDVQRVPSGAGQPVAANDGDDLAVGDRVLTGSGGTALITFPDGNTLTVQPDSDISIKRADVNNSGGSVVNIQINLGTVWARVAGLVDPNAGFTLESNTASAVIQNGRSGGQQNPDGSFQCWVLGSEMAVTNKQSGAPITLKEGETTVVRTDQMETPRQFFVNQSSLRITTTDDNALPLVVMPGVSLLAGFVAPGTEVNQVFGSRTQKGEVGRLIEVPAGASGPYRLILEGLEDGPFRLLVTGLVQGQQVFQQELNGTFKKGERQAAVVNLELDPSTTGYAKTAKLVGGSVGPLQPFTEPLPGKLVVPGP